MALRCCVDWANCLAFSGVAGSTAVTCAPGRRLGAFSNLLETHPHVFFTLMFGGPVLFGVGVLYLRVWMLKRLKLEG